MGRVYLGVHAEIGGRVAIKILADEYADSPDLLERFFAEARTVNLIKHDNIIAVHDLDRMPSGRPYIIMEYVDGRSLRRIVQAGPAPLGGAVHVALEILLALGAAHAAGIVHRDLKPDNVMLTATGRAKVLDFGIAKLLAAGPRTKTGAGLGTPEYMAPEQILGDPIDVRTDLYAAGILLYELCTGTRPFSGATDFQVMEGHLRVTAPSASTLRPDVGPALDAVIAQALAKRPQDRFQSAAAMAEALRHAAGEIAPDQWRPLFDAGSASISFDALPAATSAHDDPPAADPEPARGDTRSPDTAVERTPRSPVHHGGRLDQGTQPVGAQPVHGPHAAAARGSEQQLVDSRPAVEPRREPEAPPAPPDARAVPPDGRRRRAAVSAIGAIAGLAGAIAIARCTDEPPRASSLAGAGQDAATMSDLAIDVAIATTTDAGEPIAAVASDAARVPRPVDAALAAVVPRLRDASVTTDAVQVATHPDAPQPPAVRDAAVVATPTPPGPRTGSGWRPDPTWGLAPPIKAEPTLPPRHVQTFEHDLTNANVDAFDVGAWAGEALRIARKLEPDAQLTGFDVTTNPEGKMYWSRDRNARMWFQSPSALAAADPERLACIYVFPSRDGVEVIRTDQCTRRAKAAVPRCRVSDVFPGKIQPHGGAMSVTITYGASGWKVAQSAGRATDGGAKDVAVATVPDDC